eukprot:11213350-Lingulodinium_polyedra.AAC.1
MSEPRQCEVAALRHLARYLLGAPRQVYHVLWQDPAPLGVYSDTDWAGCAATRRSAPGGCALRGTHLRS